MNNATKNVSAVGDLARSLIADGLEVNAEIAAEEPSYATNPPDEELLRIVRLHGIVAVLEAIHDAALGAAEAHEESDESGDVPTYTIASGRLQVFSRKIDGALRALR